MTYYAVKQFEHHGAAIITSADSATEAAEFFGLLFGIEDVSNLIVNEVTE